MRPVEMIDQYGKPVQFDVLVEHHTPEPDDKDTEAFLFRRYLHLECDSRPATMVRDKLLVALKLAGRNKKLFCYLARVALASTYGIDSKKENVGSCIAHIMLTLNYVYHRAGITPFPKVEYNIIKMILRDNFFVTDYKTCKFDMWEGLHKNAKKLLHENT